MPSIKFRLKKKIEKRNYLLDEIINHNDLVSEKYEKKCKYLNHVEDLLILVSTVTGCVSISAFASFLCVSVYITSSALGIKMCAITAGIKRISQLSRKKEVWQKRVVGKN